MQPIIHISFPVNDLAEAIDFYTSRLGARPGKRNATSADVVVFGAQVTLQDDGPNVSNPMPRSRHFGATVSWDDWEKIAGRFAQTEFVVEAPALHFVGDHEEQAKLMIADPSGNLIEIKAYRNPESVLGIATTE